MAVTSAPSGAPPSDRRNGVTLPHPVPSAGTPSPPGDRLPRPPRRRRPGFAALAVLLVVGAAAAAGLLALRLDERTPILVARTDLSVGQQITRDDLAVARVAAAGLALIPASQAESLVGQYVTQETPAGRPLDAAMVAPLGLLRDGSVAIGVPLKTGYSPASRLRSGDRVNVIRAVDGEGALLARNATVGAVVVPEAGSFGGDGGGQSVVTVIVPDVKAPATGSGTAGSARPSVATQIAAAAAAEQVVLVLVERGTSGTG